jgi:hypothetical protein
MTTARWAGLFYLGTFLTGIIALAAGTGMLAANAIATLCYVAVTVLFYVLFKPVNPAVSLVAAAVGLLGCALNGVSLINLASLPVNPLAVFGVYCGLIGYLIVQSPAMPTFLGLAMIVGGASWLTFAVPSVAHTLQPYNYAPGILAEGALTVWLLVRGAGANFV